LEIKIFLSHFELTERQLEFLKLCATDLTYRDIGNIMGISFKTVEKHRDALFSKLNTNSRAGLIIFAKDAGLTDNFR